MYFANASGPRRKARCDSIAFASAALTRSTASCQLAIRADRLPGRWCVGFDSRPTAARFTRNPHSVRGHHCWASHRNRPHSLTVASKLISLTRNRSTLSVTNMEVETATLDCCSTPFLMTGSKCATSDGRKAITAGRPTDDRERYTSAPRARDFCRRHWRRWLPNTCGNWQCWHSTSSGNSTFPGCEARLATQSMPGGSNRRSPPRNHD